MESVAEESEIIGVPSLFLGTISYLPLLLCVCLISHSIISIAPSPVLVEVHHLEGRDAPAPTSHLDIPGENSSQTFGFHPYSGFYLLTNVVLLE